MEIVLVYITTSSEEEALSISKTLLEEKLIACANINSNITSLYWWEGRMEQSKEAAIIAKTTKELAFQVKERVAALHSYECPCITILPIEDAHQPFLEWVQTNTLSIN